MKIYLAQIKPYLGKVNENLDMMLKIIKEQIELKTDIVVFPELTLTGYLLEEMVYDVAIKEPFEELLECSKHISIVFGAVELGEDMYHYNTAYYLEDGEIKHKHRKIYLPTYGLFDEGRYFKEGERVKSFDTKFGKMGLLICEDMFHQSNSYILGEDGAKIVFTIVNSPVRVNESGIEIEEIWHSLCRASSVSNSNFTVMVNRVGVEDGVTYWGGSFVTAPSGNLLGKLKRFEEDGKIIEIDLQEIVKARFGSSSKNERVGVVLQELKRINDEKFN